MDQETPTTSERAVRFRAREEVALIETVEFGEPEFAFATERQRRRRRRHFMRNSVKSPSFVFSICLLAIVSTLFVYWLAKFYYVQAINETTPTPILTNLCSTSTQKTTTAPQMTTTAPQMTTTTTQKTTTTKDLQCLANGGVYEVDGWCYKHVDRADNCPPPFTLSTIFDRGFKAITKLMEYINTNKPYPNTDVLFLKAKVTCSGRVVTKIKYYNGTEIDKNKYKEYFNFVVNNKTCNFNGEAPFTMIAFMNGYLDFTLLGANFEEHNLCEFQ